jgi:hypothetical protein
VSWAAVPLHAAAMMTPAPAAAAACAARCEARLPALQGLLLLVRLLHQEVQI